MSTAGCCYTDAILHLVRVCLKVCQERNGAATSESADRSMKQLTDSQEPVSSLIDSSAVTLSEPLKTRICAESVKFGSYLRLP